jgi:HPt (histidine-containing phosphotransfer) domain-containing protein
MSNEKDGVHHFTPPNRLKIKLGGRVGAFDASAIARAEAAMASMSDQFAGWLDEELEKLEAAHSAVSAKDSGEFELEEFYRRAHDLKGLGTTYGFPIVSQFAASLCKLLDSQEARARAPRMVFDGHVAAIIASVRQNITTSEHPMGAALLIELQGQVNKFSQAA